MHAASLLLAVSSAAALSYSPFDAPEKPYPQTVSDSKNLLKYIGNRGPYSDRKGYGLSRDPPSGCEVDQVVLLSRHGERWPSTSAYKHIQAALDKIFKHRGMLAGPLEFANYWEPFASAKDGWLQEESLVGPYSGLLDAYTHGVLARRRYGHLYDENTKLPIFVSAYQRDVDTGRKFGQGFLQWNYTDMAAVNFVLEEDGANTLAPTCNLKNNTANTSLCADFGYYPEFWAAAARLNAQAPGMNISLTAEDVVSLLDLVGYELNVRGSSPWASVFTADEWVAYEYYVTSDLYCSSGPGSVNGPIEGSLFLNASRNLLLQGPEESRLPLAFSFAHDTNIVQLTAALKLDAPANPADWDPTETQFNQRYDAAEIVPQGARFIFERLTCESGDVSEPAYVPEYPLAFNASTFINATNSTANSTGAGAASGSNSTTSTYVRVVLNEAVVPLDGCSSGPGKSCELGKFNKWVDARLQGINFAEQCVIKPGQPSELTFFSNFNLTSTYNADNKYEPSQATELDSEGKPVSH